MKKLPYIEDYIILMGDDALTWPPKDPIISLARYDKPIVDSMTSQIQRGQGFTDRQSQLAYKIVTKYKKQWEKVGYSVEEQISLPRFKLPIRAIDRRKYIDIENNRIAIKFPYDQDLISKIRMDATAVPGRCSWNAETHCWEAALIEPRIVWAREFGTSNGFEFGNEFERILQDVLATADFSIKLVKENQQYKIINAESSLDSYVTENIGYNNLTKLLDYSSILAYEVDGQILDEAKEQFGHGLVELMLSKSLSLTFQDQITEFDTICNYAELTARYPIYVFETGSKKLYNEVYRKFSASEIISTGHHLASQESLDKAKVIYVTNWRDIKASMPLFITMHTFVIGHRRQQIANFANKIIYLTQVSPDNNHGM